jgi:hypothetical protein
VLVRSDEHGTPTLVADHFLPLSGSGYPADALDFYGPWKLLDGLQDCATRRQECRVALGGPPSSASWAAGATACRSRRCRSPTPHKMSLALPLAEELEDSTRAPMISLRYRGESRSPNGSRTCRCGAEGSLGGRSGWL